MSTNNDWDIIDNTNIITQLYTKINELEKKYDNLLIKYINLKEKQEKLELNYSKLCKNMFDINQYFKFLNLNKRSFLNEIMFPNIYHYKK